MEKLTVRENREHIALKICFILFFAVVFQLVELILLVLVVLQIIFRLFSGSEKVNFSVFGGQLSQYVAQLILYITFSEDKKPYPFSDFPVSKSNVEN